MSRLTIGMVDGPTPLNWTPPASCPWCTTGVPAPFERDGELAGYSCPACEWAVRLCRDCGWPSGPRCQTCRLHFRPVTYLQGLVIGDDRRRALAGMPPA